MIINNELLQRNLIGLSAFNPRTAKKISSADDDAAIYFEKSRTDKQVPYYIDLENRKIFLHSSFDPVREGLKISDAYNTPGFKIVFGLGGAYHLFPLLTSKKITSIIIVEKDPAIVKRLFQVFDFSLLFSNTRIHLLIDVGGNELIHYITRIYLPGIHGDLEVFSLMPHTRYFADYYQKIFPAIREAIDIISDDFTVQSYFGKKWFKNALNNLSAASINTMKLGNIRQAAVIGAGPSLEKQIGFLRQIRDDSFVIATDTALPFLVEKEIIPDCIISIDCQHISYLHFMKAFPADIPFIMDISSPRKLTAFSDKTLFFSSNHPFARYINKYWRLFPEIDASGGNVSHAAVSLASHLGAKKTYIFGADFSYPFGKIYARNTFIYDYFNESADRFSPLLKKCTDIVFRNNNTEMIKENDSFRYTTKTMLTYKKYLEKYADYLNMAIIQVDGDGEKMAFSRKNIIHEDTVSFFSAGSEKQDLKSFLENYIGILKTFRFDNENLSDMYNGLKVKQQEVFKTILPIVSVLIRENQDNVLVNIYKDAADWTVNEVSRLLGYL